MIHTPSQDEVLSSWPCKVERSVTRKRPMTSGSCTGCGRCWRHGVIGSWASPLRVHHLEVGPSTLRLAAGRPQADALRDHGHGLEAVWSSYGLANRANRGRGVDVALVDGPLNECLPWAEQAAPRPGRRLAQALGTTLGVQAILLSVGADAAGNEDVPGQLAQPRSRSSGRAADGLLQVMPGAVDPTPP